MLTRSLPVIRRAALPIVLGAFVATLVCAHGLPLLRHDWGLPQAPGALPAAWEATFQPLLLRGLGETNAYPTVYLVGFITMPLALLPPAIFAWVFVAFVTASAAGGGAAVARAAGADSVTGSACALFAALNPWVYTELVAGHVLMVMSYGFLMWLGAEILSPRPRTGWLVLWSALLVCQIEFFTFAFLPMTVWLVRTRRLLPLFALCIAAVPIVFGLVAHYAEIQQTPFLLEWQVSQSLAIQDALALRGYFAQYDSSFGAVAPVLWIIAATTAAATVLALARRGPRWALFLFGWAAMVFATGTKWVVAPLYSLAVLHVEEIGVFRELYDLLAISAVTYTIGISAIGRMNRAVSLVLLAACTALIYPWLSNPPYTRFVAQHLVPAQVFPGTDHERVALFPALQPLKLRGDGGGGYDPDLFRQPRRALPVNSYFPVFPQVQALAAAESSDFSELEALSVRYVISRPYLQEKSESLRYQMIVPRQRTIPPTQTLPQSYPLLGMYAGFPQIVSIGSSPLGNGEFYGDASGAPQFRKIQSHRTGTDANSGWIDARLAYASYPALATRFGGVFTRGRAPLPVAHDMRAVLAWTNGLLKDDAGYVVARASGTMRWYRMPEHARSLSCTGACMVSGFGDPMPLSAEAPAERPATVDFTWIAPWLVRASLPAHHDSTLRWNMRFDDSWTLIGTASLTHLRLDEALNAWTLPAGPADTVYLLNVYAAIQLILEFFSFLTICALIWLPARHA